MHPTNYRTTRAAGDAAGDLITSTQPTGGASAWTVAEQVDPSTRINAVSCSSRALCLAAGNDGAIIHSTNPTAGTSAWRLTTGVFRSGNALTSLSCPAKQLCFGVDKRGQVIYSRNPTAGAKTWKSAHILNYSKDWLVSIKCPTTSECFAVDRRGHTVLHSTHPTGGKPAWSIGRPPRAITNLVTASCPTTKFCAVGGRTFGTEIAYSTRPSGGATTYKAGLTAPTNPPSGYPGVDGLSCASASQCVFFAANGQVGVTAKPTMTSTSDWPALVVDAYNKLESVSCPSATLCLAGGAQKAVYTSANPTGGAGAWRTAALPIASDRVSCGTTSQCVVGDGIAGDLAATSTPLSGGWIEAQTSGDLPDGGGIAVLSCTAGPLCIAGPYEVQSDSDDEGTSALTTTNPTGGTGAWDYSETFIEGGINGGPRAAKGVVPSLSCPSQTLCVSNSLCVGVDSQGRVIHSANPTSGRWRGATIDRGFALTAVSCVSAGFCVAVDGHRHAFVSANPTGGVSAWQKISGIDGELTSIACATTSLCVAVDGQGNEVTARS